MLLSNKYSAESLPDTEWRKGNWVFTKEDGESTIEQAWQIDEGNELFGIKLTEEWLVKLGWVWNEECNSYEKYPAGDARMNLQKRELNGSYTMFNYVIKAMIAEKIFYVHQLQNLYFALTGEELTIKENATI